jgi:hypothetical protein
VRRLYKTGWIDNWIYWITHSYTQLHCIRSYSSLQFTCRVFTLYLHSLPLFQYRRIRSPATLQLFSEDCCSARILTTVTALLYSPWTDHKENTHCCIGCCCPGTDLIENAAFPLLRSRLGSDHIENMSRVVCPSTVVNKRFHCWMLTYSVHVTICLHEFTS